MTIGRHEEDGRWKVFERAIEVLHPSRHIESLRSRCSGSGWKEGRSGRKYAKGSQSDVLVQATTPQGSSMGTSSRTMIPFYTQLSVLHIL